MGAHEVGNDILLLGKLGVELLILLEKALVHLDMRLAHVVEHRVDAMLRRDLELAGDMVFDKLGEKFVILVL